MKRDVLIYLIVIGGLVLAVLGYSIYTNFLIVVEDYNLYPDNEKVMYGYKDHDSYLTNQPNFPELKQADDEFIQSMLEKTGSLENASREVTSLGWEYLREGDISTAMKRFNQAWLLNSKDPYVYWGLGAVSEAMGDFTKSIAMFEKAKQMNSETKTFEKESQLDNFYCDYGYSLSNIYMSKNDADDLSLINNAIELLNKSISLSEDTSDCCTNWKLAVAYYAKGDYNSSWDQVIIADESEAVCAEQYDQFIVDLNEASPA